MSRKLDNGQLAEHFLYKETFVKGNKKRNPLHFFPMTDNTMSVFGNGLKKCINITKLQNQKLIKILKTKMCIHNIGEFEK